MNITQVETPRCIIGEGPVWDVAEQALYFIDIFLSNGPCWSPDDKVLYHSDSIRNTIFAYDYDINTGTAANRRVFASTEALGGIPDGATIDADGCM